jgi:hypothetical protein
MCEMKLAPKLTFYVPLPTKHRSSTPFLDFSCGKPNYSKQYKMLIFYVQKRKKICFVSRHLSKARGFSGQFGIAITNLHHVYVLMKAF